MKKRTSFIIIAILSYTIAKPQGGSAGNNYVGTNFLGFNASNGVNPLQIRTNNLPRILISQLANGTNLAGPGSSVNNLAGFGLTRIGIGIDGNNPINFPRSLIHMGEPGTGVGIRDWMDLGILMSRGTDHVFFGHRQKNTIDPTGRTSIPATTLFLPNTGDANDAVISFGDNGLGGPANAANDNLTFIYNDANTGANPLGPNSQNSNYGREMMRMIGNGNIGIGPVFYDNAQPQNLLHVNNQTNLSAYLQITNATGTQQTANDGFHFGITGAGIAEVIQKENLDLRFYTFNNQRAVIKNNGFFGVNTNLPGNTTEIDALASSPIPVGVNGSSGLRLKRMTSGNTPQGNPGLGVLSVNGNGDVIYVPAGTAPTANNGILVNGSIVQLGGACNNGPQLNASALNTDRAVIINNNTFWFADGNNQTGGVGIGGQPASTGFCNTGNTFEVSANAKNIKYGNTNASGLRLTKLTSISPALANGTNGLNNQKVLTVDQDGDIVLTNVPVTVPTSNNGIGVNGGVIQLGGACNNFAQLAGSALQSDRAILNGNFNFWIASPNNSTGGFGVGGQPASTGFCNTGNTFEVSANAKNSKYGNTNASGIRFTKLTSASPALANGTNGLNNQKVLTVDQDGDVVLTNALAGGTNLGNICGATQNPLTSSWEIPMANNNFLFTRTAGQTGNVGIGVMQTLCSPGNLLEVRKGATSNISGLRLTDLVGASPLTANGNVLSVDPTTGDVILVPDVSGGPGGGITTAQNGLSLLNPTTVELGGTLLHNTQVSQQVKDMEFELVNGNFMVGGANGFGLGIGQNNILFGSQNTVLGNGNKIFGDLNNSTANSVLINGTSNTINGANANGTSVFGNFNSSSGDQNNFLIGSSNNTPLGNYNNMLVGFANQSSNGYLSGQYGMAVGMGVPTYLNALIIGNSTNHGLNAAALDVLNQGFNINALATKRSFPAIIIDGSNFIGVRKQNVNYGSIEVNAIEYGAGNSCGIWASADASAPPNTSIAAKFDGDVVFNGTLMGTNNIVTSDQQFKTNVDTISNPVAIIKNLLPKTYYLDTTNIYNMNFSSKKQYGFIAQDVQQILPELVSTVVKPTITNPINNTVVEQGVTYKSLNYNAFFALITAAMQKQQRQIERQDSIITVQGNLLTALTQSVNSCCSNSNIRTTGIIGNQTNIELSDNNVIVLNQNVPNPFAESTIITYNIPVDFKVAQIIFNTMDGRIIKAVDVNLKGKGQINVYANDLTNGLYSYYLIVDGKVIDTKKLIKQN
jgi:hypothetical protein